MRIKERLVNRNVFGFDKTVLLDIIIDDPEKEKVVCCICGREIKEGEAVFYSFIRTGILINCLKCTRPGNVDKSTRIPLMYDRFISGMREKPSMTPALINSIKEK